MYILLLGNLFVVIVIGKVFVILILKFRFLLLVNNCRCCNIGIVFLNCKFFLKW